MTGCKYWPMSSEQRRLWFLDHWAPARAAYNVPVTWRLGTSVPLPEAVVAVLLLLARHDALVVAFEEVAGVPKQRLLPTREFGDPVDPISPAVTYADYCMQQKEWLAKPEFRHDLDHRVGQLSGAPEFLELDRIRTDASGESCSHCTRTGRGPARSWSRSPCPRETAKLDLTFTVPTQRRLSAWPHSGVTR